MKRIFVLPTSGDGLRGKVFGDPKRAYEGGMWDIPFFGEGFPEEARKLGIEAHTTDAWSRETAGPDDVLLVQNHPGETLIWRAFYAMKHLRSGGGFLRARQKFLADNFKFFKRRVLIQGESPLVMPYVYKDLDRIRHSGVYNAIMLMGRGWGNDLGYYNPFFYRNRDIVSPHFGVAKEKFLVLVNGNVRPHSFRHELYGERLKAIRHLGAFPGFDLYGHGWDHVPRHPFYMHYAKYVARAWRGRAENKMRLMSQYRFAICYENSAYPGYVSEKIFDCLAAGCIPVYLGAPDIASIVPEGCFIDKRKFGTYEELHQHLVSLSEADCARYRENILRFLRDRSTMMDIQALIRQIAG
jgi:hypothetical protein